MIRILVTLAILLVGFTIADALLDQLTGAHQSRITQVEMEIK